MKPKSLLTLALIPVLSALQPFSPPALCADAPAADPRLQKLLKLYPDADTNHDGILTMEEAMAYARAHPEAISQLRNQNAKTKKQKQPAAATDDSATTAKSSAAAKSPASAASKKLAPTFADLKYGPYDRNRLDLWIPKTATAAKPAPLVVFIHGGGFVAGDKSQANDAFIRECLDRGVAFMAIDYRYRTSAPIQDILRDCARAIQYIRYHAKDYNIDPTRVVSHGGSAGAGTSLWLAFHPDLADPKNPDPVLRESSRILGAGAISTQATYDLIEWQEKIGKFKPEWSPPGEITSFYGIKDESELKTPEGQRLLDDVSMLRLITPDDPPVFMYSSMPDGPPQNRGQLLHTPAHALAVKAACDKAGVKATAYFAAIEPHPPGGDATKLLHQFLFDCLKLKP